MTFGQGRSGAVRIGHGFATAPESVDKGIDGEHGLDQRSKPQ
jgi:hypothetical protein